MERRERVFDRGNRGEVDYDDGYVDVDDAHDDDDDDDDAQMMGEGERVKWEFMAGKRWFPFDREWMMTVEDAFIHRGFGGAQAAQVESQEHEGVKWKLIFNRIDVHWATAVSHHVQYRMVRNLFEEWERVETSDRFVRRLYKDDRPALTH